MRIESGPAATDRNWQAIRTLIFLAFAGWFVYDGALGWPQAVRKSAEQAMPSELRTPPLYTDLKEHPDKTDFDVLATALVDMAKKNEPITSATMREKLGDPHEVEPNPDGSGGTIMKFASKYGLVKAVVDKSDRIYDPAQRVIWRNWHADYTRSKVESQYYWAALPGVLGLIFFYKLIKAATLRVVVDEAGLQYGGRKIPFERMTALRDYSPKGWIDLFYQDGESRERRLRLDNEKILRFDDVVDAICQKRGFENLVKLHAANQELQAGEDEEHIDDEQADDQRPRG